MVDYYKLLLVKQISNFSSKFILEPIITNHNNLLSTYCKNVIDLKLFIQKKKNTQTQLIINVYFILKKMCINNLKLGI